MQLNRQQLGSKNWGSSVNTNWGKIEQETNRLQGEINKIIKQIETEYGVMFGGFIRFDSADIVEAEKAPNYLYITPSADTVIVERSHKFFLEDGNQKSTVPINRIYRIVGNWSVDSGTMQNDRDIYSINWTEGNMCVYTGAGYRQVFWNDYIFEPSHLNAQGQLVWTYQQAPSDTQIVTSFPANFVNAVAYKYYIEDFNSNSTYLYHIIPSRVTQVEGVAITAHISVDFYNDKNKNQPFYAWWSFDTDDENNDILCLNKTDSFEEDDYVILTYCIKDVPAVDLLNTEV